MEQYIIKKARQFGQTQLQIIHLAELVCNGETVGISTFKQDKLYLNRVLSEINKKGVEVDVKITTLLDPPNNRRVVFDRFDEPIGVEILPQKEVFSGWILSRKK